MNVLVESLCIRVINIKISCKCMKSWLMVYGLPAATTAPWPFCSIGDYLRIFRVFIKMANGGICYKRQGTFSSQHPQVQYVESARNKCGTAYFVKNIKYISHTYVHNFYFISSCLLRKPLCTTTNIIILCCYTCVILCFIWTCTWI